MFLFPDEDLPNRIITAPERTNLQLRCGASGNPKPMIQWSKISGTAMPMGSWHGKKLANNCFNICSKSEKCLVKIYSKFVSTVLNVDFASIFNTRIYFNIIPRLNLC